MQSQLTSRGVKSNMAKKSTPADKLEQEIRDQYVPGQLAGLLSRVLEVETNALWCATPEGKAQTLRDHDYDEEQLAQVLEKQAANKDILQEKVDFLKKLYNEQYKNHDVQSDTTKTRTRKNKDD